MFTPPPSSASAMESLSSFLLALSIIMAGLVIAFGWRPALLFFSQMLILILLFSAVLWADILSPDSAVRWFFTSMFTLAIVDVVVVLFPELFRQKKEAE